MSQPVVSHKLCGTNGILDEKERMKKEQEQERRKLRLLQVREIGKQLARKIRNDVAAEKLRQLQKLEAIKAKELECWRKHLLEQQGRAYQEAIFHVGEAHSAAKSENQKKALKPAKRGTAHRNLFPVKKCTNDKKCSCPCLKSTKPRPAKKQFKCVCTQTEEAAKDQCSPSTKRKRDISPSSEDSDNNEDSNVIDLSSTSCSSYTTHNKSATDKKSQKPSVHLFQRPNISVDVEVYSDDIVSICAGDRDPNKSHDQYTEYNEVTCENSNKENEVDSDEDSSPIVSTSILENSKLQKRKDKVKTIANDNKKYTAIANLVKKQQNAAQSPRVSSTVPTSSKLTSHYDESEKRSTSLPPSSSPRRSPVRRSPPGKSPTRPSSPRTSPTHRSPPRPPPPHPSPSPSSIQPNALQKSPHKRKIIPNKSKSIKPFADKSLKTASASKSASNCSTRVQFYDYNSKHSKEYIRSPRKYLNRQLDRNEPTAMEVASKEKQLQKEREEELAKQQKLVEERGQKALEREQIRKECEKLTDKLEVLSRQYANKLPTEDNATQIFADKELNKEAKMNSAVEEILSKPAIITCPELKETTTGKSKPKQQDPNETKKRKPTNEINLGDTAEGDNESTSDSCCSILLDYLDEQSNQIRSDLNQFNAAGDIKNQHNQKIQRLKDLLIRLDELRNCLLKELSNGNENLENVGKGYAENVQKVAKSIKDLRNEQKDQKDQKDSFNKNKLEEKKNPIEEGNLKDNQTLTKLEKCVEKKLNQCLEEKDTQTVVHASVDKPLEIVITVKEPSHCIQRPVKTKKKVKRNPVKKVLHHMKSPQIKTTSPKLKPKANQREQLERPNSFNSNSTSYCSLPSEITTRLEAYINHFSSSAKDSERQKEVDSKGVGNNVPNVTKAVNINPLIAQYIQRLLSMPGNAIQALGVISSEIETPSSSMLQTASNITSSDDLVSREHIEFVEKLLEENRSFIKDIEENFRKSTNKQSMKSAKDMNIPWSLRLKDNGNKKKLIKFANDDRSQQTTLDKSINESFKHPKVSSEKKSSKKQVKICQNKSTITSDIEQESFHKLDHKHKMQNEVTQTSDTLIQITQDEGEEEEEEKAKKENQNQSKTDGHKLKTVDKCVETQPSPPSSNLDRNRKLTESCANRIADLTDLINRVREEKQRLLEGTISSISDENDYHSTVYLDLTEESPQHPADSSKRNAENNVKQVHSADNDNRSQIRKPKPPVTIRRFSPQIMESDVVHELSTILEVDTPTVSQMNTEYISTNAAGSDKPHIKPTNIQPVLFPTFEEYVKQLKLDLSQLDAEQSIQLHKDFCNHIDHLYQSISQPKYQEFPTINAYMENLTNGESPLSIDLESKSDIDTEPSSIKPHYFPTLKDYINNRLANIDKDTPMLDSKSLENITDDSESMNIEEELRRRNIVKKTFRSDKSIPVLTSTAHSEQIYSELLPVESGIEKLSTTDSGNTVENFRKEIKRIVNMCPKNIDRKAYSTTSNSPGTTNTNSLSSSSQPSDNNKMNSIPRPNTASTGANLRDFLTRELLKHANESVSTISTEESIRNQFLHSIIDLLTPSRLAVKRTSLSRNLERPKTSTPVQIPSSSCPSTNSGCSSTPSSRLFTGDSSISSVCYSENQRIDIYRPKPHTSDRKST